jgi:MFS superfamily sulfate permease-like transporter
MGARSQLFNVIASCIVLGTCLFAGPLFYYLPRGTLFYLSLSLFLCILLFSCV